MKTPKPKFQEQRGARWKEHFLERLKEQHRIDATFLLQWLERNSKAWAASPDASPYSRALDHLKAHDCRRVTPGARECAAYHATRLLSERVDSDHQNPERAAILRGALKRRRAVVHIQREFEQMARDVPLNEQLRRWKKPNTVPVLYTQEFSDALIKATLGLKVTLQAIEQLIQLAPDVAEEFHSGARARRLLARAERTLRIGGFEDAQIVEMLKDGGKPRGAKQRMNDRLASLGDTEEFGVQLPEITQA